MEQPIQSQPNLPSPAAAPVPPAPAPPVKKTNWLLILFGSCLIILLIILIASVAFGGYFLNKYLTLFKKEVLPKIQVTPTETQPLETQPTAIPTNPLLPISPTPKASADWKTYANKNVNFTFQYPSNMTLKEGEEGNPGISLTLFGPTQKMDTEAYDGIFLGFSLPGSLSGKTLKSYVEEQFKQYENNSDITIDEGIKEITLAGLNGYTYTITGLGTHKSIYLQSNKNPDLFIVITNSSADPTNQGFAQIIEQILASFKFLQ